jgi:transposase
VRGNRTKRYDKEFKQAAVHLVKGKGMSAGQVGKDLGVSQPTISMWVREFEARGEEAFAEKPEPEVPSSAEEVRRLQRELARVTMERDILKKAITFFKEEAG